MSVSYEEQFRENIYSVSEVNGFVKELIEGVPVFSGIKIRGEISNFTRNKSGHLYFSLKDEGSVIRAAMFIRDARGLRFEPTDGMRVVAQGRLSVYLPTGSYQITVSSLEADGKGALYEAYERLKKKLSAEGLFDQIHKRPIPRFPRTVGVITSPTGAAVRDIINVCGRRYPLAEIKVFPAVVQGEGAEASLIKGVRYFKETGCADVVIIGRGGGSIEDLWAFNSEALAREIAASGLPFISAVGHETDNTICDLVCSLRAPTPSGAAELAVPDIRAVADTFDGYLGVMKRDMLRRISDLDKRLSALAERRVLTSPYGFIDEKRQRLDLCDERLCSVFERKLQQSTAVFERLSAKLDALSPLSVLTRGYGAVYSEDGQVLTSVKGIEKGQTVKVRLKDGSVTARTEEITEEK
jgi:exodeoxyribonuclease VII large subunit